MKVGILGGGQLAQMLAQAGNEIGIESRFLCPDDEACASQYAHQIKAAYDDVDAWQSLADWADVITYEFENIPDSTVEGLEACSTVYPSSTVLRTSSDRFNEKTMFGQLGIATAQFEAVDSVDDLTNAVEKLGRPSILKTRRDGYDGKGQVVIKADTDLAQAWAQLNGVPCILESMVPFDREVSIIAARSVTGDMVYFPIAENVHREGILRLSSCLAEDPQQKQAELMIQKLANELNYVGVIALELFQCGDQLMANEMAPRVHNSGHWTQDGATVSQFENHMRAVTGMPLIEPQLKAPTAMVNIIGTLPDQQKVEQYEGVHFHAYGKGERANRKIGHINVTQNPNDDFQTTLTAICSLVDRY